MYWKKSVQRGSYNRIGTKTNLSTLAWTTIWLQGELVHANGGFTVSYLRLEKVYPLIGGRLWGLGDCRG